MEWLGPPDENPEQSSGTVTQDGKDKKEQTNKVDRKRSDENDEEKKMRLAKKAENARQKRSNETDEEKKRRLAKIAESVREKRSKESEEQRNERLSKMAQRQREKRQRESQEDQRSRLERVAQSKRKRIAEESAEHQTDRLAKDAEWSKEKRAEESAEQQRYRLAKVAERSKEKRAEESAEQQRDRLAKVAERKTKYAHGHSVKTHELGNMNITCSFCGALHWLEEKTCDSSKTTPQFTLCCMRGDLRNLKVPTVPQLIEDLCQGTTAESKHYRVNSRKLNQLLAFTSAGAKVEEPKRGGPYYFKINGAFHHLIGDWLPEEGKEAKYAQIYTLETEPEQLDSRLKHMTNIDSNLLQKLQAMMNETNPFVKLYKSANEITSSHACKDVKISLKSDRNVPDMHRYNNPSSVDVGAIIVDDSTEICPRDIILQSQSGDLKRISETHASYDPLQYVLLFPRGQSGWMMGMKKELRPGKKRENISPREFYSHRLHVRETNKHLFGSGRLFLQYVVDMAAKIEAAKLGYIRSHQREIRADLYNGVCDAVTRCDGELDASQIGQKIILPGSYMGSPRQTFQLFQDAMAIVRKHGSPDLFVTVTANPKWPEVSAHLLDGQSAAERPDLVARVFHLKLKAICNDLFSVGILGRVVAHVHTIEYQKRGLPHCHMLINFDREHKIKTPEQIDSLICAELPNEEDEPELYERVSRMMMHGPCGQEFPFAPCMINGMCRHKFPRSFAEKTSFTEGSPVYRRRDNGSVTRSKTGIPLDNRWVVPFNPYLTMRYNCHVNVEACGSVRAVKYLYKYVFKGCDRAIVRLDVQNTDSKESKEPVDEIKSYLDSRYLSSAEAIWRIFEYKMHQEYPNIVRLAIHLPGEQFVLFDEHDDMNSVAMKAPSTTLTAWMESNKEDPRGRDLTYLDYCSRYWFDVSRKKWKRRADTRGVSPCVGRIRAVQPRQKELYYMRMLLCQQKGCQSYEDIRTTAGHTHESYYAAAKSIGIANDEDEWVKCMEEASSYKSAYQIRVLFASVIEFCVPDKAFVLWDQFKPHLLDDFLHEMKKHKSTATLEDVESDGLMSLEKILNGKKNGIGRSLNDYPEMPAPKVTAAMGANDVHDEITIEKSRDIDKDQLNERKASLNNEQDTVFQTIVNAVTTQQQQVYFLDAQGGSGKTFLINTIIDHLRLEGHIVIAVASSGVASLLIHGGRTAHSLFKLPITNLNEYSRCNIKCNTQRAHLFKAASMVIWDESPMSNRLQVQCVDLTLQDLCSNKSVFGGKIVLFAGDFRQVLPVIPRGSRDEIVGMSLKFWERWPEVQRLSLTENMRVKSRSDTNKEELESFIGWLQRVGEGKEVGERVDNDCTIIDVPDEYVVDTEDALIEYVFPDINAFVSHNAAILCPLNQQVFDINESILVKQNADEYLFLSTDTISETENQQLYPVEYLNSITMGGLPPHRLRIKKNAPLMLLRNLNPAEGMANGTRLRCLECHEHVIYAQIMTGPKKGNKVFIPRITLTPSESQFPFTLQRRQFPIQLSWAMTVNKSQGQTLDRAGLMLMAPPFSHGQLYVALSRVGSPSDIKILLPTPIDLKRRTRNIVYTEVIQ